MSNRKLDALYAERVLELEVKWPAPEHTIPPGPYLVESDASGAHTIDLPHYDLSLDAAWPGVEKVDSISIDGPIGPCVEKQWCVSAEQIHAVDGQSSCGVSYTAYAAALTRALVCALLLAVGVTQDEIDATEVAA